MRVGRLVLPEPDLWEPRGRDEVVFSGLVAEPGDHGEDGLLALERALGGLVDNVDEPVVPVVSEVGSGYFEVLDVVVDPGEVGLAAGWLEHQVTLARVDNAGAPVVTSALLGHVRSNVNGVTDAAFHHSVAAGYDVHSWLPTGTAQAEERPTAPGPAAGGVAYRRVTDGSGPTAAKYAVAPDRWYRGGCHVETLAGGRWVPVVGRRSLAQPWRVGNGLVRVTLVEGGVTPGRVRIEWWRSDGQGWVTQDFGLRTGGFDATAWRSVEVTQLAAHTVTIRAQSARTQGRTTLTMTLRRGDRTVACSLDTDALGDHRVSVLPAAAVTDAVYHAHPPSAGTGNLVWVFAAADNFAVDTGAGIFTPENPIAQQWSFGLGAYFQGASGDSGSRDQTVRNWYATQNETVTFP